MFNSMTEARDVLVDATSRAVYDAHGIAGVKAAAAKRRRDAAARGDDTTPPSSSPPSHSPPSSSPPPFTAAQAGCFACELDPLLRDLDDAKLLALLPMYLRDLPKLRTPSGKLFVELRVFATKLASDDKSADYGVYSTCDIAAGTMTTYYGGVMRYDDDMKKTNARKTHTITLRVAGVVMDGYPMRTVMNAYRPTTPDELHALQQLPSSAFGLADEHRANKHIVAVFETGFGFMCNAADQQHVANAKYVIVENKNVGTGGLAQPYCVVQTTAPIKKGDQLFVTYNSAYNRASTPPRPSSEPQPAAAAAAAAAASSSSSSSSSSSASKSSSKCADFLDSRTDMECFYCMKQFRQSSTFVSCKSCYSFFSCVKCWESAKMHDHQWHKDQMTCVLEADARRVARGRAPFWATLTRHAFTNQHAKWEDDFIMSDISMYSEDEEEEPSATKRRRKRKSKSTSQKKSHYAL
jgi:hypothetical protein